MSREREFASGEFLTYTPARRKPSPQPRSRHGQIRPEYLLNLVQYQERDIILLEGSDGQGGALAWGRLTVRWPSAKKPKRMVVDYPSRWAAEEAGRLLANALAETEGHGDFKEVVADWFTRQ